MITILISFVCSFLVFNQSSSNTLNNNQNSETEVNYSVNNEKITHFYHS